MRTDEQFRSDLKRVKEEFGVTHAWIASQLGINRRTLSSFYRGVQNLADKRKVELDEVLDSILERG